MELKPKQLQEICGISYPYAVKYHNGTLPIQPKHQLLIDKHLGGNYGGHLMRLTAKNINQELTLELVKQELNLNTVEDLASLVFNLSLLKDNKQCEQ